MPNLDRARAIALKYLQRTNSLEDAEDAVQEALLKTLKTKSRWRGDSSFETWFMRVAINSALMQKRKARARKEELTCPIEEALHLQYSGPSPEQLVLIREREERLIHAIAKLKPLLRDTLLLHYWERPDTPFRDLAADKDVKAKTLKSRDFRARRVLAQRIAA
jgi:RNA polymerase sigma-70 factor (ECF subfamily)